MREKISKEADDASREYSRKVAVALHATGRRAMDQKLMMCGRRVTVSERRTDEMRCLVLPWLESKQLKA